MFCCGVIFVVIDNVNGLCKGGGGFVSSEGWGEGVRKMLSR